MLSQLYIENVAVIEKATIEFHKGFNILTGETGAGKSIIIDSMHGILGERTSKDMVRNGAESAFVSGLFTDLTDQAISKLRELGFEPEEDTSVLVQRTIQAEGKSTCRINGRPATVSALKELGKTLMNIHGQHESYHLLSPELHIHYIDESGDLNTLVKEYRNVYQELKQIQSEIGAHATDEAEKLRRIDLLTYQIEELEQANLRENEKEELMERKTTMMHAEKIASAITAAKAALDGDESFDGVLSTLTAITASLQDSEQYLPALNPIIQKLHELSYGLEDVSEALREQESQMEFDASELLEIETRLDLLYRLSIKYGQTTEEMLAFLERCRQELSQINHSEETLIQLNETYEILKEKAIQLAKQLSDKRKKTAEQFTKKVKHELQFLNMPGIEFQVEQERVPLNSNGCDKIQFLISVNPGEPAKPIAKIASGGELSRIMLAIQTVLSAHDDLDTMIFDEVDTGISGSAAQKVGLKLHEVSKYAQVICITHLAQIACLADYHLLIQKQVTNHKTYTQVIPLSKEAQTKEIARMIGGEAITPLLLQNAQEMIDSAKQLKA
ncbi:MAG: DNA repair protein RecN [Clostridium sp.]|nr:DNA repair protein RecN [Clostridium sp.]